MPAAREVLKRAVQQAFASGLSTSEVMRRLSVSYEYAYEIKMEMRATVVQRPRRRQTVSLMERPA